MYMVTISLKLPKKILELIDELVREGLYPSRSEVIRTAIIKLLREYYRSDHNG